LINPPPFLRRSATRLLPTLQQGGYSGNIRSIRSALERDGFAPSLSMSSGKSPRSSSAASVGLLAYLVLAWSQASGATLTSIAVTPTDPTLQVGQTQTVTAVGTFDDSTTRPLTPSVPLAAGERHSCVVLVDGGVRCWGNNGNGQLGNGTLATLPAPVAVSGVSTATGVAAGVYHTCARLSEGAVRCWGYNGTGQLGNGTLANSTTPVPVSGLSTATVVATGAFHSCAVLADGSVRCWGQNVTGQLGNGAHRHLSQ
jgi:peptidoglycan hydrolase-like protein with peptidoglycan-binding domain